MDKEQVKEILLKHQVDQLVTEHIAACYAKPQEGGTAWFIDNLVNDLDALLSPKGEKPPVLALKDTITWDRKFKDRKVFRKEQIIELIKQFMTDQRDADVAWRESQIKQAQDEVIEDLMNALRDPGHPLHQKVLHHIEEAMKQQAREIFKGIEGAYRPKAQHYMWDGMIDSEFRCVSEYSIKALKDRKW